MTKTDVVIAGGGISGLSTAFYLKKLGIRSLILEKETRLGGLIKTNHINGCELEASPPSPPQRCWRKICKLKMI
jgi:oxygen-dependent protoporphyrinogen oxidase